MTPYTQLQTRLQAEPKTWLVTGVAGFIGSNLLEGLALAMPWYIVQSYITNQPVALVL